MHYKDPQASSDLEWCNAVRNDIDLFRDNTECEVLGDETPKNLLRKV